MSQVADLRYEFNYLTDSATQPQSALSQYQFTFAQGLHNGYGSLDFTISASAPVPYLYIPNQATVFLETTSALATIAGDPVTAGLTIANATLTPFYIGSGVIPTRVSDVPFPSITGQIISIPGEWSAASQGASDPSAVIQLAVIDVHASAGFGVATIYRSGDTPTGLSAPLTGRLFWYY